MDAASKPSTSSASVEKKMEEEAPGASAAAECSPSSYSQELLDQIRELEESHTRLEQEMKKNLEQRELALEALRRQEVAGSSASAPGLGRRSMSMSPTSVKHSSSALRRTFSQKISEKGLCEEEVNDLRLRTLSVSEDRYVDILQSMGQAVYIFTTSAEVTYWNRMAERLYGWSASEAIGRNVIELLVDNSSMELATTIVERLCVGESWVGQFPLKKKSGEIIPAMITNTPFFDNEGNLVGVIGVSSDARPFTKASEVGSDQKNKLSSDWQQPWQIPFATTITSLANKILSHLRGNIELGSDFAAGGSTADASTQASKGLGTRSGSWTGRFWSWSGVDRQEVQQTNHDRAVPFDSSHVQSLENKVHSNLSSTASMSGSSCSTRNFDDLESPEYEILWDTLSLHDPLGRGSCATVYRGTWCGLDVAVKVFNELQYNDSGLQDFREEVAIMKKLRHPNIVLFLGAACTPERLYLVTELMPRGSLFKLLHKKPSGLDWKRKLTMALDVARGMTYLHNCTPPIVHRDLKSTNLLVDRNFKVKVGDFSLSRLKHSNYLTGNARMGTSQWMPPEVLRSETSNEKSDVYSFGVILWELATEEVPWKDLDPLQVIAVVGFKDKRLQIPENLDSKFAATIQDCWKSAWEERPSFEDLTVRLKEMLTAANRDSQQQ